MVEVTRATREKSKLRIALAGVSGGGKTLGALLLASGLTGGDFSKVCLIDTEHRRGELYANRTDLGVGEFWYIELKAPYSPEHYKECVDAAVKQVGPDGVVIVDSLSHAWSNAGGVLEIKNMATEPRYQRRGYGKQLIEFLVSADRGTHRLLRVGTGDSPATIPFYEACGFRRAFVVKNFFVEHYRQPIFEQGVQLVDMVYLERPLG